MNLYLVFIGIIQTNCFLRFFLNIRIFSNFSFKSTLILYQVPERKNSFFNALKILTIGNLIFELISIF
jgi:hypothetical protein